jgi:hypothetical protein
LTTITRPAKFEGFFAATATEGLVASKMTFPDWQKQPNTLKGTQMTPKSPLKSKTIWVNSLMLLAALLATTINHDVIASYPEAIPVLGAIAAAVNIVLRFVSSEPIK